MTTDQNDVTAVAECRCGGKEHMVCVPTKVWSRMMRTESPWAVAWRWATRCAKRHPSRPGAYRVTPWDPARHRQRDKWRGGPCWSCGINTDYGLPDQAARPGDAAVTVRVKRSPYVDASVIVPLCWRCHIQQTPEQRAAVLAGWSAKLSEMRTP